MLLERNLSIPMAQLLMNGHSSEKLALAEAETARDDRPWNADVRGTQVLPLINCDCKTMRVPAGPGTGKTFGLRRRVLRLLHPDGLGVSPNRVLVCTFNR